ncbi:hypothetical protein GCM10011369_15080 [Neiella marina]|uniref:Uncharacterized protein n=1 Tax=Neiella marina TaxID=508461 RepID=A0A8J2U4G3_9GAMM|nr:hypothetical protein GCM10011369_15080 [Neiella marina]
MAGEYHCFFLGTSFYLLVKRQQVITGFGWGQITNGWFGEPPCGIECLLPATCANVIESLAQPLL